MLKHIISKEIQGNLASPKLVFSFLICTILILVSFYTGIDSHRIEVKEYREALSLNRKGLELQSTWTQLWMGPKRLFKPPEILGTIVAGIRDAVGRNTVAGNPKLLNSKYAADPASAIYGPLDVALIVKTVLSLFAILFTFDVISGEKQRGTLKLSLSNSVPRDRLILGKAIGGCISLLLPLAIPSLIGLIVLNLLPDISLSGDDWIRLGLILVCFLLYVFVFFNLGLLVSSWTDRSSTSLYILLFIWVVLVFVIPKAANVVAGQILPIPSIHEIEQRITQATQEIGEREWPKVNETQEQWWIDNGMSDEWAANPPEKQVAFIELNRRLTEEVNAKISSEREDITDEYEARRRRQQLLSANLARISPASTVTFSTLRLAKTGISAHERFIDSVRAHEPVLWGWIGAKRSEAEKVRRDVNGRTKARPAISLDGMPQFRHVPESLSESLHSILHDVGTMVLLNILLFAGAFVSFLKYDVR